MGTCCQIAKHTREPFQASLLSRSEVSKRSRLVSIHKHYQFIKVIGHGQFGTVREAVKLSSTHEAKSFAIKSISKEKVLKKFNLLKRELEALTLIDHPNIVRLYEIYEDEKYLHLVLDLCRGGDLYDHIIAKGSLNEQEVMSMMRKMFSAINHLHGMSICHRDLKPDNFLLVSDQGSEIKLADFGMSVRFGNDEMHTVVGTPYYLAPEVYKGNYGKECDVWSLGVVLFFLLSGKQPFKGTNVTELLANILKGAYSFCDKKWKNISDEAKDLITKILVIDPRERISISDALTHSWFHKKSLIAPVNLEVFHSIKSFKSHGKLWQELIKVFIRNLSEEEIKKLDGAFKAIDIECSGFITAKNIEEAMSRNGYPIIADEIHELINMIEYIGKGKLNYTQFLIAAADRKSMFDDESIWAAFKYFDVVKVN